MSAPPDVERDLERVVNDLRVTVATLEGAVKSITTLLEKSVSVDRFISLEEKVTDLENLRDWAVRIVLAAVFVALLALVIKQGGAPA